MSLLQHGVAFSNRSRGLPKLGRNCHTPDPSPTRDAKDLPSCAAMELEFLVEVDGEIQEDGFLSDHEEDERPIKMMAPCSGKLEANAERLPAKVGTSSLQEELEAENYRLAKENEALKKEKALVEENHRLLLENTLLRQRCDEIKRIAQTEIDGTSNVPSKSPMPMEGKGIAPKANSGSLKQAATTPNMKQTASPPLQMPPGTFVSAGLDLQNSQNSSISLAESLPGTSPSLPLWWMGLPVQVPVDAMAQAMMASSGEKQLPKPTWHQSRADRAQQLFAKQAGIIPSAEKHVNENLHIANVQEADQETPAVSSKRPEEHTTVMIRNLPNNYSRAMLIDLIDSEGFQGRFDFLYLPIDFNTKACLGYAFVNLVTHEVACEFMGVFADFSEWIIPSRKHCIISWSGPHQGLEEHIDRYRNSPVMHAAVPDECKPVVFKQGVRMPFPPPTKKVRAPRVRQLRSGGH